MPKSRFRLGFVLQVSTEDAFCSTTLTNLQMVNISVTRQLGAGFVKGIIPVFLVLKGSLGEIDVTKIKELHNPAPPSLP